MRGYRTAVAAVCSLLLSTGAWAVEYEVEVERQDQAQIDMQEGLQEDVQQDMQDDSAVAMHEGMKEDKEYKDKKDHGELGMKDKDDAQSVIAQWPEGPKQAAQDLIDKYGAPSGVTPSRLIWDQPEEPWHEVIVYSEPVQHNFPIEHQDFVEHAVLYDVPADKFDDLAELSGSIFAERTTGRLAARCKDEASNTLALNLAHQVITDEKTVAEAREDYSSLIQQAQMGQTPDLMQELAFAPASADEARDPDSMLQDQMAQADMGDQDQAIIGTGDEVAMGEQADDQGMLDSDFRVGVDDQDMDVESDIVYPDDPFADDQETAQLDQDEGFFDTGETIGEDEGLFDNEETAQLEDDQGFFEDDDEVVGQDEALMGSDIGMDAPLQDDEFAEAPESDVGIDMLENDNYYEEEEI